MRLERGVLNRKCHDIIFDVQQLGIPSLIPCLLPFKIPIRCSHVEDFAPSALLYPQKQVQTAGKHG